MIDRRPYYVAFGERFSYVRGYEAACARLGEYIGASAAEVRELRKRHMVAGLIKRVTAAEAQAAGVK